MQREIQSDGSAHYTLTIEETKKAIEAGIMYGDASKPQIGFVSISPDRIAEIESQFKAAGIELPWNN